jgi:RNA polymerase sigma-70 factor (ECF subfamily)
MAVVPFSRSSRNRAPAAGSPPGPAPVVAGPDDAALVSALTRGDVASRAELFERYASHVQRVLVRVLGFDPDLADLLHEVFVRALAQVARLEDPAALKAWLTAIAVFTAREHIRRRTRSRWLRFFANEELPEPPTSGADHEARESLQRMYAVLARLPIDDRIAFSLRFIEGLDFGEVAVACGVSLNTIKRRLARAEKRFVALARNEPALHEWLERGTRCQAR